MERITPPPNPTFAGGPKMFLKTNALFSKTFEGQGKEATYPPFHTRTQEHEEPYLKITENPDKRRTYINYICILYGTAVLL